MLPAMLILLFFGVWVADVFMRVQVARTEAHRDAFDKVHSAFILPMAFIDKYLDSAMQQQFGAINEQTRQHPLPPGPPDIPASWTKDFAAPGGASLELPVADSLKGVFGEQIEIPIFDEGFSNAEVEGWEYMPFESPVFAGQEYHLMTYAVSARSPWTWLGWPLLSCQDMFFEPKKVHEWHDSLNGITEELKEALKLAD